MTAHDSTMLKKVTGLLVVLKENHEKSAALIEEIAEVLGGGPGVAAQMNEFEKAFARVWEQRYSQIYVWRYAVDRPNIKRLLRTLGLEELKARAFNYLRSDDPFIVRSRHPFGLFVSGINSYANEGQGSAFDLEAPAVADCQHTPRCASDQVHTQRKMREMRT